MEIDITSFNCCFICRGGLISKFDSERIINIAFTSVIVSIILVTIMIGLPQIKASKNVRNMSK